MSFISGEKLLVFVFIDFLSLGLFAHFSVILVNSVFKEFSV